MSQPIKVVVDVVDVAIVAVMVVVDPRNLSLKSNQNLVRNN